MKQRQLAAARRRLRRTLGKTRVRENPSITYLADSRSLKVSNATGWN